MMEAEDYTFAEMADIHFFYGRANGNAHGARRLNKKHFRIVDIHAAEHFRAWRNICGKEVHSFP